MATTTDLDTKRGELNAAIDNYKQVVSDFNNAQATQTDVDNARAAATARGDEYAKLTGQVKKDNPGLAEDDFFSNPGLQTAEIRSQVATLMRTGTLVDPAYLYDDFTAETLDANRWERIGDGDHVVTIADGTCSLDLSTNVGLSGIISKQAFPVGTRYKARVKNPAGRHGVLIGLCNTPTTVSGHGSPVPAMTWYARGNFSSTTVGSYRDENAATDSSGYTDVNHMVYNTVEILRVSETRMEFYLNGSLKHVVDGPVFANDYKVFFGIDGYDNPNQLVLDWVEVIGPDAQP